MCCIPWQGRTPPAYPHAPSPSTLYIGSAPGVLPTLVITGGSSIVSNSVGDFTTRTPGGVRGGFAYGPAMWAVRTEGASLLANNTAAYVSGARSGGLIGGAPVVPCRPATAAASADGLKAECAMGRHIEMGMWPACMCTTCALHVRTRVPRVHTRAWHPPQAHALARVCAPAGLLPPALALERLERANLL